MRIHVYLARLDSFGQIGGVPCGDSSHEQMQTTRPTHLTLKSPISQFAMRPLNMNGPGDNAKRFALSPGPFIFKACCREE